MNLIQSNFGGGQVGNFELVTLEGSNLVHYYRDNSNPQGNWQRGKVITSAATGEGWIIQSKFGNPPTTNFEVVALEGKNLVHYFRENKNPQGNWQRGRVITGGATGMGVLLQSNFGGGQVGNFEVVVPEGANLVHYYRDNMDPTGPWQRGQVISAQVSGPAGFMQSDFGGGFAGNFEVVTLEGANLVHYYRDNYRDPRGPWYRGAVVTSGATGPGCIIQSKFGGQPGGNFEVVVPEGANLVHYYRDNTTQASPWKRGLTISTRATGPGCIIQSNFGGSIGNFEVVVPEGSELAHYYRDNTKPQSAWQRGRVVAERTV